MKPSNLLITAGPTREPIDAVRFVGNRSSGRMGLALAEAASEAGHSVTLLLGPIAGGGAAKRKQAGPISLHRFETSADLAALLKEHFPRCDGLLMAAAVADYRPARSEAGKWEREAGGTILELVPVDDLLAALSPHKRPEQWIVAFALEDPDRLESRARTKMTRKGVDAIVANPLTTMDADHIESVFLTADGRREQPGTMSKADFARWLIQRLTRSDHTGEGRAFH